MPSVIPQVRFGEGGVHGLEYYPWGMILALDARFEIEKCLLICMRFHTYNYYYANKFMPAEQGKALDENFWNLA